MENIKMYEKLEYTFSYLLKSYKECFEDLYLSDNYKYQIIGYLAALRNIGLINSSEQLLIVKDVLHGRFEKLEKLDIFGEK